MTQPAYQREYELHSKHQLADLLEFTKLLESLNLQVYTISCKTTNFQKEWLCSSTHQLTGQQESIQILPACLIVHVIFCAYRFRRCHYVHHLSCPLPSHSSCVRGSPWHRNHPVPWQGFTPRHPWDARAWDIPGVLKKGLCAEKSTGSNPRGVDSWQSGCLKQSEMIVQGTAAGT